MKLTIGDHKWRYEEYYINVVTRIDWIAVDDATGAFREGNLRIRGKLLLIKIGD